MAQNPGKALKTAGVNASAVPSGSQQLAAEVHEEEELPLQTLQQQAT